MSFPVISATTMTRILEAADKMRRHGVGALPVLMRDDPGSSIVGIA